MRKFLFLLIFIVGCDAGIPENHTLFPDNADADTSCISETAKGVIFKTDIYVPQGKYLYLSEINQEDCTDPSHIKRIGTSSNGLAVCTSSGWKIYQPDQ